ncbi:MAG: FISUMP domain-containing protein, partial [Bacteroidales bacterium]|nr:FISUMP domain-containing protein [Bacteroidales bacterium]
SSLTGLAGGTTHYVRAYATNSFGTVYGAEKSFTTLFECGTDQVKDAENNYYATVQIGEQCWMAENLRTTTYADGTIVDGSSYYNPNVENYGYLYTWSAVMKEAASSTSIPSGVRGICPIGWHVPSYAEWNVLVDNCGGVGVAGSILKSTTGWSALGNGTDDYGFSVLPAGYFDGTVYQSDTHPFWSTTMDLNRIHSSSFSGSDAVGALNLLPTLFVPVRCVHD